MVGFTAAMEDFDETRSVREFLPPGEGSSLSGGPQDLSGGPQISRGPEEDRVEEWVEELVEDGDERGVRVRARTVEGRVAVRAQMQLLGALEVAGLTAAPVVLSIEDEGYVREVARPLATRTGKRVAGSASPATAERAALGRARDDLDALVDALHERSWLLGASPGGGLGMRPDGSVILLDLGGLRPGEGLAERRADRRWVDSVLRDEQRTLRRRVHQAVPQEAGSRAASAARAASSAPTGPTGPTAPAAPGEPPAPGEENDGGAEDDRPTRRATAASAASAPLPSPRLTRARTRALARQERRAPARARGERPSGDAHPAGDGLATHDEQETGDEHSTGREHRTSRHDARAGVPRMLRQAIAQRGLRRTFALTAAGVLAVGALLGTGSWLLLAPGEEDRPAPQAAESTAVGSAAAAPAPEITDPWALAAELAGSRHAYITGLSSHPAAAPGSRALAADQQVRQAYQGMSVTGGGAVIHEAHLLEGAGEDARAVLEVTSSTEAYEVEGSDGVVRTVAASEPVILELSLRWDGARWLVVTARTMGPATAP